MYCVPVYVLLAMLTLFTDNVSFQFLGKLDVFLGILPLTLTALCGVMGVGSIIESKVGSKSFQRKLERYRFSLVILTGLTPFLYWYAQRVDIPYIAAMEFVCVCVGFNCLMFTGTINYRLVSLFEGEEQKSVAALVAGVNIGTLLILLIGFIGFRMVTCGVVDYEKIPLDFIKNISFYARYYAPILIFIFSVCFLLVTVFCTCVLYFLRASIFNHILQGEPQKTQKETCGAKNKVAPVEPSVQKESMPIASPQKQEVQMVQPDPSVPQNEELNKKKE